MALRFRGTHPAWTDVDGFWRRHCERERDRSVCVGDPSSSNDHGVGLYLTSVVGQQGLDYNCRKGGSTYFKSETARKDSDV